MPRPNSARARHRARELLVKAVYQWEVAGNDCADLLAQFKTAPGYARVDQPYFRALLASAVEDPARVDALISSFAERGIDQLDTVGRAILRIAFIEFEQRLDVPPKVVINEAVDLAKKYGATETFRFVNAVLDRAARSVRVDAERAAGVSPIDPASKPVL